MSKIYFRADGDSTIGLGHVSRCIALAEMLNPELECILITRSPDLPILTVKPPFKKVISLDNQKSISEEASSIVVKYIQPNDILVLDGYDFDVNYQKTIKDSGSALVCMDDHARGEYNCDVIINHAMGLDETRFEVDTHTKLCLGSDYIVVRSPFLASVKKRKSTKETPSSVLIAIGGADNNNLTLKIIEACEQIGNIKDISVLTTKLNYNADKIDPEKHRLYTDLNAEEVCNLMLYNDLIICPSSTIAYEALCTGMLVCCGYFVDNQKNIYSGLVDSGVAYGLGDLNPLTQDYLVKEIERLLTDESLMNDIRHNQQEKIDGRSGERILNVFKALMK